MFLTRTLVLTILIVTLSCYPGAIAEPQSESGDFTFTTSVLQFAPKFTGSPNGFNIALTQPNPEGLMNGGGKGTDIVFARVEVSRDDKTPANATVTVTYKFKVEILDKLDGSKCTVIIAGTLGNKLRMTKSGVLRCNFTDHQPTVDIQHPQGMACNFDLRSPIAITPPDPDPKIVFIKDGNGLGMFMTGVFSTRQGATDQESESDSDSTSFPQKPSAGSGEQRDGVGRPEAYSGPKDTGKSADPRRP
jgi:hypothetical protein